MTNELQYLHDEMCITDMSGSTMYRPLGVGAIKRRGKQTIEAELRVWLRCHITRILMELIVSVALFPGSAYPLFYMYLSP